MKDKLKKILKQYYKPVSIVLISKFFILLFVGQLSVALFGNSRAVTLDIWSLWNVWDSPHYIFLAHYGYQTIGDPANFIVFFPLLPLLIFLTATILHIGFLISGYLVSLIITILLAVMLYKLTQLDYQEKIARMSVLFLFIFPTAFFLHIPYTESLFLLLSVSAFYLIRKQQYWIGFLLAGLATGTKLVGVALLPALLIEIVVFNNDIFKNLRLVKLIPKFFFYCILSQSGLLIFLMINFYLFGNFFQFAEIQKQHFYLGFSPWGQGLIDAFHSIFWRVGLEKIILGYAQILFFLLGLITTIYVLLKLRISYGVFMLIVLCLSFSVTFWSGMPRYILSLFPMYIALAIFAKNAIFKYFWIVTSIASLIFFSLIFTQYGPIL